MPLPMVHLSVGKNMLDAGFKAKNASLLYPGLISPDAIHMRPNADRHAKKITHLSSDIVWRETDLDKLIKYIMNFLNSNKGKADTDFLHGYCIHILTDMYWVHQVHSKFVVDYSNDTNPVQDEAGAYYNDTDIVDYILFNERPWKNDIWESLQNAEYTDFLDLLSAQEIEAWNKRTLHWYDSNESQHKNPIKYITQADIEDFISSCAKALSNHIHANK